MSSTEIASLKEALAQRDAKLASLQQEYNNYAQEEGEEITSLRSQLREKHAEIEKWNSRVEELEARIYSLQRESEAQVQKTRDSEVDAHVTNLRSEHEARIASLQQEHENHVSRLLQTHSGEKQERDTKIAYLTTQVSGIAAELEQAESKLYALEDQLRERDSRLLLLQESRAGEFQDRESEFREREAKINALVSELHENEANLAEQLKATESQIHSLTTELREKEAQHAQELNSLYAQVAEKKAHISNLESQLSEKTATVSELEARIGEQAAQVTDLATQVRALLSALQESEKPKRDTQQEEQQQHQNAILRLEEEVQAQEKALREKDSVISSLHKLVEDLRLSQPRIEELEAELANMQLVALMEQHSTMQEHEKQLKDIHEREKLLEDTVKHLKKTLGDKDILHKRTRGYFDSFNIF